MVANRYKGNLLGRYLQNPSIRASQQLRVNDKPLLCTACALYPLRTIFGLIHALLWVKKWTAVFTGAWKRFLRWSKGVSWSWCRVATLGRPLLKWSFRIPVVSTRRLGRDKVDCETWNRSGTENCFTPLPFVQPRHCSKSMSAQIKCETFAYNYRILKNDQQIYQSVTQVSTAQNFCKI
jgi:hypothetical protein